MLLGLHAHLNSIFAHIIEYNFFYHIIEEKEIEVLQVSIPTTFSFLCEKSRSVFQDLVHALRLAPDKSSVNISSCSEDISKEEAVTKDSTEEIIVEMKDETEEQGEVVSEAVINCDENATLSSKGNHQTRTSILSVHGFSEPTAGKCCEEADRETNLTKC